MNINSTAAILIGYQNDYFAPDGILTGVIEESSKNNHVVENTLDLLRTVELPMYITTPIIFSDDYSELVDPVGILKTITEVGAFKKGTTGSETIPELEEFRGKITEIPGKQGLNAFVNTDLEATLRQNNIDHVVLAGAVASICIDSTGRAAFEMGFGVTVLSDCISGRTVFEQQFYCENVYPLYGGVMTHAELGDALQP